MTSDFPIIGHAVDVKRETRHPAYRNVPFSNVVVTVPSCLAVVTQNASSSDGAYGRRARGVERLRRTGGSVWRRPAELHRLAVSLVHSTQYNTSASSRVHFQNPFNRDARLKLPDRSSLDRERVLGLISRWYLGGTVLRCCRSSMVT